MGKITYWGKRLLIFFFMGLLLPTGCFIILQYYYGISPSIYLTSGLSSVLSVLMTIFVIEYSKEKGGFLRFFGFFGLLYVLMLIFGVSLNIFYGVPPIAIAEIGFSSLFGVCVGFAITYVLPKKTK